MGVYFMKGDMRATYKNAAVGFNINVDTSTLLWKYTVPITSIVFDFPKKDIVFRLDGGWDVQLLQMFIDWFLGKWLELWEDAIYNSLWMIIPTFLGGRAVVDDRQ